MRINQIQKSNNQPLVPLKLGTDYGGWTVYTHLLKPNSIVYSFGIGEDISFDLALIQATGVSIHAFDPTPKSMKWLEQQSYIHPNFHSYGVGLMDKDGVVEFTLPANPEHVSGSVFTASHLANDRVIRVPMLCLNTIMSFLKHRHIDLLKMDIEGSEYPVIHNILKIGIKPTQLLIEFHHRFESLGIQKTIQAIQSLQAVGYEIFHEQNNYQEVSFVLKEVLHGTFNENLAV